MLLTPTQTFIIILAVALGTIITRFTPFIIFPEKKTLPMGVVYLGKFLPCAMMGFLVVYCVRDISFLNNPHGIPEILAILLTVLLHKWRRNVLLSICGGTALYMFLVQVIFK